jgi:RHS repeat-associated protein
MADENLYEGTSNAGTLLQATEYQYFDAPADGKLHGRVKEQQVTLNGLATTTTFEYVPKALGTFRAEPVLVTTQTVTGHDHEDGKPEDARRKTVTSEHSQVTGELVLINDHNGVSVQITQNELGQVITEIVAPGEGAYEARRTYSYALCPNNGPWDFPTDEQVHQSMTNARGVKTVTYTDGLGRPVREERDHIDERDENTRKIMMDTVTLAYDALGQKTRVTATDYRPVIPTETSPCAAPEPLTLTCEFSYDGWGQECCVQGPDRVKHYTDNDPTGQGRHDGYIRTQWAQSPETTFKISDKREIWLNRFDKPDQIHRLEANTSIARQQYEYDGLGNTKVHVDERENTTRYDFDAWNRMTRTTLPDGTQVNRSYTKHSSQELPSQIDLAREGGKLKWGQQTVDKPLVLGTRTYDSIDRLKDTKTGERKEELFYRNGKMQPDDRETAARQTITYGYDLQLTETPTLSTAPDDTASFTLDKTSALLKTASNKLGRRDYEYDWNNRAKKQTWQSKDGASTYTVEQGTSPLGRLTWQQVEGGHDNKLTYNDRGQLKTVTGGDLFTELRYDTLGRLTEIELKNSKTQETLLTTLEYNVHGQEKKRTFKRTAQPERTLAQEWWPDALLKSRTLQEGEICLLEECFTYDKRARLTNHACSGRDLPRTPQGREYTGQTFDFDDLDNIIRCVTQFADGTEETATFDFKQADPCQLTRVTYSPPRNDTPAQFTYDANGCQTIDENGRAVTHDSQLRLRSVGSARQRSGGNYGYDAHGHLTTRADNAKEGETALHFQGNRLRLAIQNAQTQIHLLYAGEIPLGQQGSQSADTPVMFSCDASGSVIADSLEAATRHNGYSAYGERFDALAGLLGFNGESLDPVSGWYLLGRGHRAYDPTLMRFLSPDTLSPFDSGGINCYAYCQGNPITFRDPTGRSRSMGEDGSRSLGKDGTRTLEMTPEEIWMESMRAKDQKWLSLGVGALFTALSIVGAALSVLTANPVFIGMAIAGAVVQTASFVAETVANFGHEAAYGVATIIGYVSMGLALLDSGVNGVAAWHGGKSTAKAPMPPPKAPPRGLILAEGYQGPPIPRVKTPAPKTPREVRE